MTDSAGSRQPASRQTPDPRNNQPRIQPGIQPRNPEVDIMKIRLPWILALVLAALVGFGFVGFQRNKLAVLVWLNYLRDPLQPYQEIRWQPGPEAPASAKTPRQPNIIVIMADDLGHNDITAFGGGIANGAVPTPNIDSIGRLGAIYDNGYAGHSTCAPSRAAMMTGRFPTRYGFEFNGLPKPLQKIAYDDYHKLEKAGDLPKIIAPVLFRFEDARKLPRASLIGLPASEPTLPEALKAGGYRTLMVGKWHLGDSRALQPGARGFDEWVGMTQGAGKYMDDKDPNVVNARLDFDPTDRYIWPSLRFAVKKDFGRSYAPDRYLTDYLGDEAVRAIAANRNRPFFLYASFTAPHTPLQALKSDYDALGAIPDHGLRVYAAMIRALDRNVGKILAEVERAGLTNNTLIVFTSDNGGTAAVGLSEINAPFRGWKSTFFEGGVRVPFFVKWPGKIQVGSHVSAAVSNIDIYATALAAAGIAPPVDRAIDGRNIALPAAEVEASVAQRTLFWRSLDYRSIIANGWKLQTQDSLKKSWLFHLATDPLEHDNVAANDPERLAMMQAKMAQADKETVPPFFPALIVKPVRIDQSINAKVEDNQEYVYWGN